jgi:hypothetical protein
MVLLFRVSVWFFIWFFSVLTWWLDRAAPTTWGVFAPAFCVAIEGFISESDRVNSGRIVLVCDVGGSGVSVENDFISDIYSGTGAGANARKFCSH